MQILYQSDNGKVPACVATVGFFDGVHAGHRFLIEELKSIARKQNLESVVITFAVHPRKVLNSDFQPQLLTTLPEKLRELESTGIDICIVLDFNKEMAGLSAYDFLKNVLFENYHVKTLLVGHDHRFGHNRADGFPEYYQYGCNIGIEVIQAKKFSTDSDNHISSSVIRKAIQSGEIEIANRLLTYNYSLRGKVVDGFKNGRKIGFPTANLDPEDKEKLVPPNGVYAVIVYCNSKSYVGMMNIGVRPTLKNGENISLEVFILDFNRDIYNETIEVEFIHKIRDEKKFKNVDELVKQLQKDKEYVSDLNLNSKNE
jgi:riboflavin kinase/FMN adenylyltransferase